MRTLKLVALLSLGLSVGLLMAPRAQAAQIGIGINVGPGYEGPAPACPYGYYDAYPYACAPYGYYGPEWFTGGVFIGAGPWFHGYHGHAYYDGGRGFVRGPVVRDRDYGQRDYGRAPAQHPAFHGDWNHGHDAGHVSNSFHGNSHGNDNHGGNGFHGGGRR